VTALLRRSRQTDTSEVTDGLEISCRASEEFGTSSRLDDRNAGINARHVDQLRKTLCAVPDHPEKPPALAESMETWRINPVNATEN
jgi:hypothetical protein